MRKLWNHYDPLDIDDDVDGQPLAPHEGPVPARVPVPRKKKLMQRLQDWLFHVEEEEEMEPALEPPRRHVQLVQREETEQRRQVQKALEEWKKATAYFESVSDPELVDYAVYDMEAAKKRYIFLLRNANRHISG